MPRLCEHLAVLMPSARSSSPSPIGCGASSSASQPEHHTRHHSASPPPSSPTPACTGGEEDLCSFALTRGGLISSGPLSSLASIALTSVGPYERVLVAPLAGGTDDFTPVLYGLWRDETQVALLQLHAGDELQATSLTEFTKHVLFVPDLSPSSSTHLRSHSQAQALLSPLSSNLMVSITSPCRVLGVTSTLGSQWIVFEWEDDGLLHQYLRQFEPSQLHRIQRVKRTRQMMAELRRLHEVRVRRVPQLLEPAPRSHSPPSSSPAGSRPGSGHASPRDHHHAADQEEGEAVPDIPSSELSFDLDSHGARRILGSGAYATVYLGRWRGTPVAIKVLHHSGAEAEQEVAREVAVMARTHSPHIVRVEGTCLLGTGSTRAIVLELLAHGDLFSYLQEHDHITWSQRLTWMRQLSGALSALHRRGISHRDQKSLNCLLDADLNLKLTDFGLSNCGRAGGPPQDDVERVGRQAPGAVCWMAPEFFAPAPRRGLLTKLLGRGRSVSHMATDVWSFGWVVIEMMTGRLPFHSLGSSPQRVIPVLRTLTQEALRGYLPPFPASCPAELCDLIHACLAVDDRARPTMASVHAALERMPLEGFETITSFKTAQEGMAARFTAIAAFERARRAKPVLGLHLSDDEARAYERDLVKCREAREFVAQQSERAAASQPTQPDTMIDLDELDIEDTPPGPTAQGHSTSSSSSLGTSWSSTSSAMSAASGSRTPSGHSTTTPPQQSHSLVQVPTATYSSAAAAYAAAAQQQPRRPHLSSVAGKWHSSTVSPESVRDYEAKIQAAKAYGAEHAAHEQESKTE